MVSELLNMLLVSNLFLGIILIVLLVTATIKNPKNRSLNNSTSSNKLNNSNSKDKIKEDLKKIKEQIYEE